MASYRAAYSQSQVRQMRRDGEMSRRRGRTDGGVDDIERWRKEKADAMLAEIAAKDRTLATVRITDDPHKDLDRFLDKARQRYRRSDEYERELELRLKAGDTDSEVIAYAFFRARCPDWEPALPVSAFLDDEPADGVAAPVQPIEPMPMLVGVREVCARLGLKRMQLKRLRDNGQFPAPVANLAAGPIWKESDLP